MNKFFLNLCKILLISPSLVICVLTSFCTNNDVRTNTASCTGKQDSFSSFSYPNINEDFVAIKDINKTIEEYISSFQPHFQNLTKTLNEIEKKLSQITKEQDSYMGCYKDNSHRAMPNFAFQNGSLTIQSCIGYCKDSKLKYAGMQAGTYCFCAETDSYAKYGKVPSSECNFRCRGNHSEFCGGGWRNSVYATGSVTSIQSKTKNLSNTVKELEANLTKYSQGQYIGCYKDDIHRAMPNGVINLKSQTVQSCVSYCKRFKFVYAGMQAGSYCFCGNNNSYAKYGKVPSSACNERCGGNSNEFCGGVWKNSVYATGL